MKNNKKISLNLIVVFSTLFLTLVPIIVALGWTSSHVFDLLLESELKARENKSLQMQEYVSQGAQKLISELMNKAELVSLAKEADLGVEALDFLLTLVLKHEVSVNTLLVLDAHGASVGEISHRMTDSTDIYNFFWPNDFDANAPIFVKPMSGEVYVGPLDLHDGMYHFMVAVPMWDMQGQVNYIMMAEVESLILWGEFVREFDDASTGAYLVTDEGRLMTMPANARGHIIGESRIHQENIQSFIANRPWDAKNTYIGIGGYEVYGFVTDIPVSSTRWGIVSEIPVAEVVGPIREAVFFIVIVISIIAAVICLIGYWLMRKAIVPIKQLAAAFDQVSKGDYDIKVSASPIKEIDILSSGFHSMLAARARAEEKIKRLAHYDTLTGLPNRNYIYDHIDHVIANADRYEHPFGIFFLDLDGFKAVNDELGHDQGDEVLRIMGHRFLNCCRSADIVGRIGGDEFLVVATGVKKASDVAVLANRIIELIGRPVTLKGQEYTLGVSIGVAVYPYDGTDKETLMHNADLAMYQAKSAGKNQYKVHGGQPDSD